MTTESRTYNINIGDDFIVNLAFATLNDDGTTTPIDLTGYSFKMQIRECQSDVTVIVTLESSDSSEIDISDAVNGNIIIKIANSITDTFTEGTAVFDLVQTNTAAQITTVLKGNIEILERVTKN